MDEYQQYLKKSMELHFFSKYRSELMGIATILIIVCHAPAFHVAMPPVVAHVISLGGVGVDLFLFLSGMGMFYSYSKVKTRHSSILKWYIKRYIRLIVPTGTIIWPVFFLFYKRFDFQFCLGDSLGVGTLFGYGVLWFLGCIILLYFITPLIDKLLAESERPKLWLFLLIGGGILVSILLHHLPQYKLIQALSFDISRFPSYFIGYYIARCIKEERKGSIWWMCILPAIGYFVCYALNHKLGFNISLFWMQGLALTTICMLLVSTIKNAKILACLSFLGAISLESYVTNDYVIRALQTFDWKISGVNINPGNYTLYVGGTIVCIGISYAVNKLSKKIINSLKI